MDQDPFFWMSSIRFSPNFLTSHYTVLRLVKTMLKLHQYALTERQMKVSNALSLSLSLHGLLSSLIRFLNEFLNFFFSKKKMLILLFSKLSVLNKQSKVHKRTREIRRSIFFEDPRQLSYKVEC